MARTYKQPGLTLTYENGTGSDISAGDVVVTGDMLGFAEVDIADGESGSVSFEGVHEVTKVAGTAWTQGDKIDYDASASGFNIGITAASGDVEDCGVAAFDAASGDTTAYIKLTPGVGTGA